MRAVATHLVRVRTSGTVRGSIGGVATTHPVLGTDPAVLHSRPYLRLLALSAVLGVPIAAGAFVFLQLVHDVQHWVYVDVPEALGYARAPDWWAIPLLVVAGLLVGLCVRYLPGGGGHPPVDGFDAGHAPPLGRELGGITLAALASLGLGAVVGPEAPLIALGAGVAAWAVRSRRGTEEQAVLLVGAAGSFAAISLLLGNPLIGAFLLMEASALGGATLGMVLLPGLLSAGIGALVLVGLGSLSGLGTITLTVPGLPEAVRPDLPQFGWAVVVGLLAPPIGVAITWLGRGTLRAVRARPVLGPAVAGLLVGLLALGYAAVSDRGVTDVVFSGQEGLTPLLGEAAGYSAGGLLVLFACKGLAYGLSLGAFRGGPVFPAVFLGAAGGIVLSHLPGLPPTTGAAMGIGAMCVVILRLPMTSVLLATLLLDSGVTLMPLVIVSVVVAHVLTAYLTRRTAEDVAPATQASAVPG